MSPAATAAGAVVDQAAKTTSAPGSRGEHNLALITCHVFQPSNCGQ